MGLSDKWNTVVVIEFIVYLCLSYRAEHSTLASPSVLSSQHETVQVSILMEPSYSGKMGVFCSTDVIIAIVSIIKSTRVFMRASGITVLLEQ